MLNKSGMEIPWEVADGITLANLKDNLQNLEKELQTYDEGNLWMHPDDADNSRLNLIPALKVLVKFYGG
jgi:hypothetical protein